MKDLLKVSRYQLFDFKKPIIIYYLVIGVLIMFAVILITDDMMVGGFGSVTVVFLFIAGLNCFRSNFKFMQAFNVSRKRFFFGSIIAFVFVSLAMALIDIALNYLLPYLFPYEGFYYTLFNNHYFYNDLIWSFLLYLLSLNVGFFITMLYYKCSRLMKIVISLSPIYYIIILSLASNLLSEKFIRNLEKGLNFMLGISTNSYMAVLSFLIGISFMTGINYLLIRKMDIKN